MNLNGDMKHIDQDVNTKWGKVDHLKIWGEQFYKVNSEFIVSCLNSEGKALIVTVICIFTLLYY